MKIYKEDALFYSDDYSVYKEIISAGKLAMEKRYTIDIEQNNSNVRHFLG